MSSFRTAGIAGTITASAQHTTVVVVEGPSLRLLSENGPRIVPNTRSAFGGRARSAFGLQDGVVKAANVSDDVADDARYASYPRRDHSQAEFAPEHALPDVRLAPLVCTAARSRVQQGPNIARVSRETQRTGTAIGVGVGSGRVVSGYEATNARL